MLREIEPDMFLDCEGLRIELGDLVTPPANVRPDGKPVMFKGIAQVVGRHEDENIVFIRYMGEEMVHSYHPSKLVILAPKRHREIIRHRSGASLARAA